MRNNGQFPAWGVLVKAHIAFVRGLLAPLSERFDPGNLVYRTHDGWTALFNMEPSDTADNEAAERLRLRGYVPVYRFDFNKYEYLTFRWDGARWNVDKDPLAVLGAVGIECPGWDELFAQPDPPVDPGVLPRQVTVIEGATVEDVRALMPDRSLDVKAGPRGALLYVADVHTRLAFWNLAPQRVFELKFYPRDQTFCFRIMKGEDCLGSYRPGETRTWDGAPFLPDVDGETEPAKIIAKFGIDPAFLAT